MKTIWNLYKPNSSKVAEISKRFKISELTATIILNRNKKDINEIESFLNPNLEQLHSPFLLNDMKIAVDKIIDTINQKKLIIIYGDYDVDGVTATSILYNYLFQLGANVRYYLPNRFEEGYGLNIEAIDKLSEDNPDLIITVDCGIASIKEVELLNDKGINIIITDHHECQDTLPNALAIINPKRKDSTYPFKFLCGAGVSFKLIQAISNTLNNDNKIPLEFLDLVCLATIADIVPLVDENRVIVSMGINYITNTKNHGLKSLINIAGVRESSTFTIGFALAPRINAAGRMGVASRAVEMFTTNDFEKAYNLAEELDNENRNRQKIEAELTNSIIEKIEENKLYEKNIIIVNGEGWHHGIIGIIASKLVDRYYKPCIIISFEDGIGTGSCRSVDGVNIFDMLNRSKDLLIKFGGHELAAGISINEQNLDQFINNLEIIANKEITEYNLSKKFKIDYLLKKEDLELDIVEELKIIEPYGSENPQPYVGIKNCKIEDIIPLSEGKHLKLKIDVNGKKIYGIGFGIGELAESLKVGQKVSMVGYLNINEFNGNINVQFNIKDIKKIS